MAVLFSEMTPDPAWETSFNNWYDSEHIPLRVALPGFLGAQRYQVHGTANYLAVYDMESPTILESPAYREVKTNPSEQTAWMLRNVTGFTRYIGQPIGTQAKVAPERTLAEAPILYPVFFQVPDEREQEFNEWYDTDHVPTLLKCDDWLMVRRFRIVDGSPGHWTHLALHYLADVRALESPEREEARSSPWRAKLAQEPWFKGQYTVFEKHGLRFAPSPGNAHSIWT